jgi:hypothetical protein
MDNSDKQEILDAIGALTTHVDERLDGIDKRMGAFEDGHGSAAR